MPTISKEKYRILSRRCEKIPHRIRENKYGVCWCTICGRLFTSSSIKSTPLRYS
nr:MAG TPA: met Zinc-finger of C2H2 type [Bacteriophage sp.]